MIICDLIDRVPRQSESSPVNIGATAPASLVFVVKDYAHHLRQHVRDLLAEPTSAGGR